MAQEDGDTILTLTSSGRCPMWREDGLCRIQAQLGEEALCHTCSQFPRLRHDYGDFAELGLELSCPEAARLILTQRAHWITETVPGGEAPEYDTEAMAVLLRTRQEIVNFLFTFRNNPGKALAVLLLYGYQVQEELDGGEPAVLDADALLRRGESLAQPGDMASILDFFKNLELLTDRWQDRLSHPIGSAWTDAYLALAIYFVNRYWLQAVSDYDLVCRVKLAVVSCLLIRHLGGDLQQTAQLYSKEIENDADNVEAILDGAYTAPAFTDLQLLGLLLEEVS
jgi:lysine-N-methylase